VNNIDESKEIKLESNKFNDTYKFMYQGSKEEASIKIAKILSPAVQEKLVALSKLKITPTTLFTEKTLTFMFDGSWNFSLKTNFKESLEIKKEDISAVDKEIHNLTDIVSSIIKYLD
jgi:hypothetical protein